MRLDQATPCLSLGQLKRARLAIASGDVCEPSPEGIEIGLHRQTPPAAQSNFSLIKNQHAASIYAWAVRRILLRHVHAHVLKIKKLINLKLYI